MPTGTMAQQIALRIWSDRRGTRTVAFHPTCHLELHEQKGYQLLHGLHGRLVGDPNRLITLEDLESIHEPVAALLLELPQREIGGLLPGSELGWTDMGWTASARSTGLDQFRFLVFNDPTWDIQKFDFDRDLARAEEVDRDTLNALDPNLKPFIDRGGKLIQYHGWADPQISPANSTQYYTRVVDALGGAGKVHDSYRLFMAPGMGHCGGGEGPNTFDMVAALEQWVEQGRAPDQVLASHSTSGVVDRTRPLCPYPQIAAYKGTGSIDEAANFVCRDR
jgi:feruloyl esterase